VSLNIPTSLGRVYVEIDSDGEPMLLLPSLLTDHTLYARQVSHFSGRYMTIAVDPPGQGRSEPLERCFTFEESARAYVEIIDALQLPWAHVVGNSWGAMIGGTIAATYPDRVGCSVLMNGTASPAPRWDRLQLALLAHLMRRAGRPLFIRSAIVPRFLGATTRRQQPALVDEFAAMVRRNNARSATFAVESIVVRRPDQHRLFERITTPVLVIAGGEDESFPVPEARRMAEAIPKAEFVILEQAGHLAAYEAPDTVNALIDDFIDRANCPGRPARG
jgi:3-oxoadipate enol-lactonase